MRFARKDFDLSSCKMSNLFVLVVQESLGQGQSAVKVYRKEDIMITKKNTALKQLEGLTFAISSDLASQGDRDEESAIQDKNR